MDILKELESLKAEHYYCDDSWYSCPLAPAGCANDSIPEDECTCGALDQHKRIDKLIEDLTRNGFWPIQPGGTK